MKILITRDSGLLGSNLCFLWRNIYDIIGVSRRKCGVAGVRHISLDLTIPENVNELISTETPDIIIHAAALVNIEECQQNSSKAKLFNADMTEHLVGAARKIGAYFVYISMDAFYETPADNLSDEVRSLKLKNIYAETKRLGEIKSLEYANSLCLRTNIYGFNFLKNKLSFAEWILSSLIENKTLTMFTDVNFSPILVNDLTEIIEQAIAKKLTGIYNAGGNGSISKHDFAVYLKKKSGITTGIIEPTLLKDYPFTAWRSANMSMDNSKIEKTLSIKTPTIFQGIDRFLTLNNSDFQSKLRGVSNV